MASSQTAETDSGMPRDPNAAVNAIAASREFQL
jgi:hypothetical protein